MAEEGAPTTSRHRKLRNVCAASDYDELRKAYRFVPPEPPSEGVGSSSNWQERMARRYESHLYREFVLADLTRHQMGQIGLRWRTKDEVCSGKGFDTCGNKHCPSYRSPDGSSFRDIEAAKRASLSRTSEESVRRYLTLQEQKEKVCNQASRATHRDCVKDGCREEEEEMNALSQLPYGSGLADYEVPFTYMEQEISKTELVKLRLCLRCAPLLFSQRRGGSLGAKRARERSQLNDEQKLSGATTKQENNEDASSESSQRSWSSSADDDSRRKRRASKKSRKRKKDKRHHRSDRGRDESGERRRKRKRSRGESRRNEKKESKASASALSDDISIEGRKAEGELLASLNESNRS